MRLHRDEGGQTIILVALSLPLLLGFIGIATDVGALFKDKRTLQTAADAAAIAGALNLNNGYSAWVAAAQSASGSNGFPYGGSGVTITTPQTPQWPSSNYLNQPGYVEVTITKVEPTIFLTLFGYPTVTVKARAVATNNGPPAACMYTTSSNLGNSLVVPAASSVSSLQCGLVVDSNVSPPMNVIGTLTMKSIGTVGSCSSGCGGVSPTPVSGIVPYSDPLSFLPQFTCNISGCSNGTITLPCVADPNINTSTPVVLTQTCYNGLTINGTGTVTFSAGTYVINGPVNFQGSNQLTGTGVTFYINSGAFNISKFASLNLSAPTSGTYNGILFFQGSSNPPIQTITVNPGSTLEGILYFPNAELDFSATSATLYTDFVAQNLSFTGAVNFNDYASLPNVTSPLSSVVLVE
jgi:Flp pilus assembly protein TadG